MCDKNIACSDAAYCRYMLDQSGNVKRTFSALDRKIMGLLSHRYDYLMSAASCMMSVCSMCPAAVRQGYDTLKGFLAKRVQVVIWTCSLLYRSNIFSLPQLTSSSQHSVCPSVPSCRNSVFEVMSTRPIAVLN